MDLPKKEVSSAATPREVDLFAEEALEEVFETIDSLHFNWWNPDPFI